jgi:hypothetical protein
MIELFATYGPDALAWVLAALGTALTGLVGLVIRAVYVREIVGRAWNEISGAALEVAQTYADAIKERRGGGLTDDEKREARTLAIESAKANLGKRGVARLARVIGIDVERYLGSKLETAVKMIKVATAAPAPIPVVDATTIPPPIATTAPALPPRPR